MQLLSKAHRHVRHLISNAWKELNKGIPLAISLLPNIQASINTARMVQVMYSNNEDQRLPMLARAAHHFIV